MKIYNYTLFGVSAVVVIVLFSTGCTNAIPQSTVSSSVNLSAPTVNGSSSTQILISAYNSALTLNGSCTTLSTQLQASFDGGNTWGALPSGSADNCATSGAFAFQINDASALGITNGFNALSVAGATESFQLRNVTPLGNTPTATVTLELPPAYNRYLADIRSGAATMNGSHYKITGKFGSAISKPTLAGSTYKIQLENQ